MPPGVERRPAGELGGEETTGGGVAARVSPDPLAVHPAAAAWPALPDHELVALADSIRAIGLLEPLVVTPDGRLLDGRNRYAACRIAGVEPTTVVYTGDPVEFVLSRNGNRRHMSAGRRAIAALRTAGSNLELVDIARSIGVPKSRVSEAKLILRDPELADQVLTGQIKFGAALRTITARIAVAQQRNDRIQALVGQASLGIWHARLAVRVARIRGLSVPETVTAAAVSVLSDSDMADLLSILDSVTVCWEDLPDDPIPGSPLDWLREIAAAGAA